jgi:hypothetical protein
MTAISTWESSGASSARTRGARSYHRGDYIGGAVDVVVVVVRFVAAGGTAGSAGASVFVVGAVVVTGGGGVAGAGFDDSVS